MNDNSARVAGGEQPSGRAEVLIWTAPVVQEEKPTSDAEVTIEATRARLSVGMRVPGANTGQMINAMTRLLGLAGSVVGPVMLLKCSVDLLVPWYGTWALALVLAILPVVHVVFGNRHDRK